MTTFTYRPSLLFPNDNVTALYISQDGTSGTATSAVLTVPANKLWQVNTANVKNPDTTARAVAIEITDGTNVIATIAGDLVTTNLTGVQTRFVGDLVLTGGQQIRANVVSVGAFVPTLQITGYEASYGFQVGSFPIN
jgi:hypothetical protein